MKFKKNIMKRETWYAWKRYDWKVLWMTYG